MTRRGRQSKHSVQWSMHQSICATCPSGETGSNFRSFAHGFPHSRFLTGEKLDERMIRTSASRHSQLTSPSTHHGPLEWHSGFGCIKLWQSYQSLDQSWTRLAWHRCMVILYSLNGLQEVHVVVLRVDQRRSSGPKTRLWGQIESMRSSKAALVYQVSQALVWTHGFFELTGDDSPSPKMAYIEGLESLRGLTE